ncbi:uncharacterized protein LOC116307818 [Actinia tenebrosa]|uniref:Uncharacterized protein LOC116307818 n=1 Tax=Actinia tenebrosa TaxID=6105 RepID=A0A6P8JB94_ACTTE|nr:uncharacterized protein LOC116307818 [Actinia tenebrosa]
MKDIFDLKKMSIPKVAQLLAFLLILQQAIIIYSFSLNFPPIRDYVTLDSNDIGATKTEFVRKRPTDSEYEDSLWIGDDKDKRTSHRTARIYKNKFNKCLIINNTGKVEASTGHICNTYGRFCHISNGSTFQLLGIRTGRYLAIDDNANIYSTTNRLSKNTELSYELGNILTYTLGIYRKKNNKKCYLEVLSNAVTQTCSLKPRYLEPINAGTC